MRLAWLSLALSSLACSNVSVGPKLAASEVIELGAVPPGYEAGEELRASCNVAPRPGALDDETLANVDCNFERLSRVLRARAGELSASLLVRKSCDSSGFGGERLECSATIARGPSATLRSARGPAPSPAQVLDLDDPRPRESQQIRVSYEPKPDAGQPQLPERTYDRVVETAWPAVGRRVLGNVSAHCDSCTTESLRYALRVTAGRAGAGEVSQVRCFEQRSRVQCVAIAFVPWSS